MNAPAAGHIRRAAQLLRDQRPAYRDLLACYEAIFLAQEQSRSRLNFSAPDLSEALLALKEKEALPLIDSSGFRFDTEAAAALMDEICRILQAHNPKLAEDAAKIARARDTRFQSGELFSALLNEKESDFNETAHRIGVDRSALAFVAYCSLRPSLSFCADQLAGLRRDWEKGYCPICGQLPGIAVLDETGRRFLHCSFCWHKWPFPRTTCPFCETKAPNAHKYLYTEEEKELRAAVCDVCRRYIKTVDMRSLRRPIYPPLEQIASLHMDLLARRQGYESGAALPLEEGGRP